MASRAKPSRPTPRPREAPRPTALSGRIAATTIHDTNPIPVRALIAIAGTVLGLVLLLSFKTPDTLPTTARHLAVVRASEDPSAEAPTAASIAAAHSSPAPSAAPSATSAPGATAVTPVPATPRPASAASATPEPTATATPKPASADVKGPIEQTPFGDVEVEVKVSGGRIANVVALQLPYDRRHSQQISQYVEPILHDEVLQAQSAQIDLISGATWTSEAYQASVQGALDQIGNRG